MFNNLLKLSVYLGIQCFDISPWYETIQSTREGEGEISGHYNRMEEAHFCCFLFFISIIVVAVCCCPVGGGVFYMLLLFCFVFLGIVCPKFMLINACESIMERIKFWSIICKFSVICWPVGVGCLCYTVVLAFVF